MLLAQRCQQLLDRAELRITRLKESIRGGEAVTAAAEAPFLAVDEDDEEEAEA